MAVANAVYVRTLGCTPTCNISAVQQQPLKAKTVLTRILQMSVRSDTMAQPSSVVDLAEHRPQLMQAGAPRASRPSAAGSAATGRLLQERTPGQCRTQRQR